MTISTTARQSWCLKLCRHSSLNTALNLCHSSLNTALNLCLCHCSGWPSSLSVFPRARSLFPLPEQHWARLESRAERQGCPHPALLRREPMVESVEHPVPCLLWSPQASAAQGSEYPQLLSPHHSTSAWLVSPANIQRVFNSKSPQVTSVAKFPGQINYLCHCWQCKKCLIENSQVVENLPSSKFKPQSSTTVCSSSRAPKDF